MSPGEIITGKVESIAFGGQGVVRHDQRVIFVPYVIPGETVRLKIDTVKKRFALGSLLEVIDSSPDRIIPRCPYFGTCGGCQLQHVKYEEQLQFKRAFIKDALKRIGNLSWEGALDIIPACDQWSYRRHITLHIEAEEKNYAIGYRANDNSTLVPIMECPIFNASSDPIIGQARKFIEQLQLLPQNLGRISLLKGNAGKYIIHVSMDLLPKNASEICANTLSKCENWQGIVFSGSHKTLSFGDIQASMQIEDCEFLYSPHVFVQNHPEQSANIYRYVKEIVSEVGSKCILDLYCGIGILSILLAKQGCDVTGVEVNRNAIALAKENSAKNKASAQFFADDVKHVIRKLTRQQHPDMIIINPPRTGLEDKVRDILCEAQSKQLIYISCMPATLARDLQALSNHYEIVSCRAFDMFPQTTHVETVVHLRNIRGN